MDDDKKKMDETLNRLPRSRNRRNRRRRKLNDYIDEKENEKSEAETEIQEAEKEPGCLVSMIKLIGYVGGGILIIFILGWILIELVGFLAGV